MNFELLIKTKYKDTIYQAMANYKNNEDFELSFSKVHITSKDETKINVYITVFYHYYEYSDIEKTDTYIVKCVYDLELETFSIISIYEYEKERFFYTLSPSNLVPRIAQDKYNLIAEEIIEKFGRKDRIISAFDLAEKMGLEIRYEKLSLDSSVFGITVMNDTKIKVYNYDGTFNEIEVSAGTILIDRETACEYAGNKSINFTVMHECVHWYLHRKVFLLNKALNGICSCNEEGIENVLIDLIDRNNMEYQANEIASRILLPSEELIKEFNEFNETKKQLNINDIVIYEKFIKKVSDERLLSLEAVKIQLLKYDIPVQGIYEFMDDRYIQSYLYKKGSLSNNETFSLTEMQFKIFLVENKEFLKMFEQGLYIFVDNHLCIRSEKYVKYIDGEPYLTSYALENIEECCFKFTYQFKSKNIIHSCNDTSMNRTCKKTTLRITDFKCPEELKNNLKQISKEIENENKLLLEIQNKTINDALRISRESLGISRDELAERAVYSSKTIENMENGKTKHLSLENILRYSLGLHLTPRITFKLIEMSGHSLSHTGPIKNAIYSFIINNCYTYSNIRIDEVLTENGIEPLFEEDVRSQNY
ncbi:MAG: XRE family transcriptional regulator [Bacilli bacterium]|nr:XRE family transcriptional regulator [Bacilli bacterium]